METDTFHGKILESLGELKGQNQGIIQHLATLNGTVAKHEGQLQHMAIEDGKLSVFLEGMKATQKKDSSLKAKWLDRVLMLVFMGILQLGLLLLLKSGIVNLENKPQTADEVANRIIELQSEAQKLENKIPQ